jgi:hypothetical protein
MAPAHFYGGVLIFEPALQPDFRDLYRFRSPFARHVFRRGRFISIRRK